MPAENPKSHTSYRVIYGDTDQMGVSYYANYLRWFEIGRTEFLREMGVPYGEIEGRGLRFPVTEVSCRYFSPARYDETIVIETALTSARRASVTFSYSIFRKAEPDLIASGWTKHACVNRAGEITRMPEDLEKALKAALSAPTAE